MLVTLDILIGFSVVMLIFSMPVTLLTQAIITLTNLRGTTLRKGVVRLLILLDDRLAGHANGLADTMLKHPLVATQGLFGGRRLASVVLREELARLILYFGGEGAQLEGNSAGTVALRSTLARLGISDPDTTLAIVRAAQLALEKEHPEMAADARATAALLEKASSDFLARFNAWYDQTMDRVSQAFALYSRVVTLVIASAIALVLQVDSIGLINRLASDDAARDALVATALAHPERFSPVADQATIDAAAADLAAADVRVADARMAMGSSAGSDKAAAALAEAQRERNAMASRKSRLEMAAAAANARLGADAADAELAQLKTGGAPDGEIAAKSAAAAALRSQADAMAASAADLATVAGQLRDDPGLAALVKLDLIDVPESGADWLRTILPRLPGIFVTAALLSLGGGFWYEILGNLLKFRPLLAKKDEGQRLLRQTQQTK